MSYNAGAGDDTKPPTTSDKTTSDGGRPPENRTGTSSPGARSSEHTVQTRTGRNIRVSHRRTPSELTPLMQENLALQQQIEILQAQQQMLAQQQFMNAGMMPPPNVYGGMPPGLIGIPQVPVPQLGYGFSAGSPGAPGGSMNHLGTHNRARSFGGPPSGGPGHHRRHSLAVSEARKAAQVEQARRADNDTSPQFPATSATEPAALQETESTSFRFPPSPERRPVRTTSPLRPDHSHSSASPVRNHFQFPSSQSFTPGPRQQGYSHYHRRSNSRNFDANWRQPTESTDSSTDNHQSTPRHNSTHLAPPSSAFVPGHGRGGSFNSVSSISAFTEGTQSSSQAGRKSLFVPYLSQTTIPQLLAEGRLVSGTLRVNRKNRSDAYVSTDVLDSDIFICGSKDRNRALEGDIVAVELLDVNDVWDSKREKEEKKRRRDANDDSRLVETATGELRRRGSLKQRPTQKRNDDVEVEGQTLFLKEEEQHSDETKPLYAGHVVAILERPPGQLFSGTLGLLRPSSQATRDRQEAERAEKGQPPLTERQERPKIVWFKPTDKCVPLMAIPTEQAPQDFVENHQAYADKIFVAAVKRWPITSLHPFGTLVEELGNASDEDVEVKAMLRDNNFSVHKFSATALQVLQEAAQAMAHEAEQLVQDVSASAASEDTGRTVVKGSPVAIETTDDLCEQALQVDKLSNGNLALSVHTLDLTPFIKEESALDRELRHKSTGVYMQQFTSPLIPSDVVGRISFAAKKPTPALTVTLELDPENFDVLEVPSVRKTVVTPDARIHQTELSRNHPELLQNLKNIANKFREQRNGYPLEIDELLDVRVPVTTDLFAVTEISRVIDEINNKVNATIAQKVLSEYGDAALLRRQGEPTLNKLEDLGTALRNADIAFDASSAPSIGKSLTAITDPSKRQAAELGVLKCLSSPRYAVAGRTDPLALGYYWLNLPAYTHFNAPLRRYSDLVVHRQVHACLSGQRGSLDEVQKIGALAQELSFKYDCAKNAQEQSVHLAISQRIHDLAADTGYILRTGIVVRVYESALDVVVPELGIEKRVHGDQLPVVKAEFDKKGYTLELFWDPKQDTSTFVPPGNSRVPRVRPTSEIAAKTSREPLEEQLKALSISKVDSTHVQKIKMLDSIPIMVRADLGTRVLPSITIRAVNPFYR